MPAAFGAMGFNPMQAAMQAASVQPGLCGFPSFFGVPSCGGPAAEGENDTPPSKRQVRGQNGSCAQAPTLEQQPFDASCIDPTPHSPALPVRLSNCTRGSGCMIGMVISDLLTTFTFLLRNWNFKFELPFCDFVILRSDT